MLNGLDAVFPAARARGVRVIAIVWLDTDPVVNEASITAGIAAALAYPDTIIRLSCGSEVRTRNGPALDATIDQCLTRFRAAGVTQPLTSIDTWWEWCNASWPCQPRTLAPSVDWIGVNVFPWWEDKYSGIFPCTPAAAAADFHIARMQNIMDRYPSKPVVLTEFGWPSGPDGYAETNTYTGQGCGVASQANQSLVVKSTLAKLQERQWSGVAFSGFREAWKTTEGAVGPFWGLCGGVAYRCVLRSLFARSDLIIDFGPGVGVWMLINNSMWRPLHPFAVDHVLAVDLDQNLDRDLLIDFATPDGMWAFMNGTNWVPFHPDHARNLARGDLDGDGQDDLVVDFGPSFGIWTFMNHAIWKQFDPRSARQLVVADIDGNGQDDLLVDFGPSMGLFLGLNGAALTQLHGLSARDLIAADLDGNGRSDIVIDFGPPYGVWAFLNGTTWVLVNTASAKQWAVGDLDATGRDAVVIDFGSAGMWIYRYESGWTNLHPASAAHLVVADLDGTGKPDVVIDFGPAFGVWVWWNQTNWMPLHNLSSRGLFADEIVR